jgi:tellurite methyltransferase
MCNQQWWNWPLKVNDPSRTLQALPNRPPPESSGGGVFMSITSSVQFFDSQFQRQVRDGAFDLNPFEIAALPYLRGRLLDFGCGLGNLAITAAQRGCSVVALDGSSTAIARIRAVAAAQHLPIHAMETDLRTFELTEDFDSIVSIGLLMFFDCPTAIRQLGNLQAHVRPGGTAIVNVLIEGTTYLDMFDATCYCLFSRNELRERFAGWDVLHHEYRDFEAPKASIKSFVTLIARKPLVAAEDEL